MRKYISCMLLLVMVLGITSCDSHLDNNNIEETDKNDIEETDENDSKNVQETAKVIGLSVDQEFESRIDVVNAIKDSAKKKGYRVEEVIAHGDAQTQALQIESLIEQDVDVLLVCAVDQSLIEKPLAEVKQEGIPIVAFDRNLPECDSIDAYVGPNSINDGMTCGYAMIEALKGEEEPIYVLDLVGALNDQNGIERSKGFNIAMKSMEGVKVIQMPTDWDEKSAMEAVQNAFQSIPNIRAVFCATDSFVPGVNQVLNRMGLKVPVGTENHIFINGVNGSKEGYEAVVQNEIDGFMVMNLDRVGQTAVELVQALINGKQVQNLNLIESTYYDKTGALENQEFIWGAK